MALQQETEDAAAVPQAAVDQRLRRRLGAVRRNAGQGDGLVRRPGSYLGQLRLEIARAARLVVDTGMHAKGWTREQAIAYWIENAAASAAQAHGQIERYMAWPGQALGYKIGSLKILELRERAKQRLGDKFSMAAFHDAVLGEGPLPLSVLEKRIERWMTR